MLSIFLNLIDDISDKIFFEQIYENYQKQMFYIAFKILEDEQLAEDALQNTFLRMAINIKTLRKLNETEAKYYLYVSIKNAAIDLNKKLSKTKTVNIDDFYDLKDENSSVAVESHEDIDYIIDLIRKLPDKYSDVMYMRYVTGLTDKEISKTLNRKLNTVHQQATRGRQKFIELYEIYNLLIKHYCYEFVQFQSNNYLNLS
mgnify:CR=1 FL=1